MSWKPIESAPKDGTNILLWEVCIGPYIGYWEPDEDHYDDGKWEAHDLPFYGCPCAADSFPFPKFWMELPSTKLCEDKWFNKGAG